MPAVENVDVVPMKSCLDVSEFAVGIPDSITQGLDEPQIHESLGNIGGIVGTIIYAEKSATIWLGWGDIIASDMSNEENETRPSRMIGTAKNRKMGPLISAMPRTRYSGSEVDPSTSKLIGCESEDDEMIARQMSARLSQRLGVAIFISCNFDGAPVMAKEGVDEKMIKHRAAALAERELHAILKQKIDANKDK